MSKTYSMYSGGSDPVHIPENNEKEIINSRILKLEMEAEQTKNKVVQLERRLQLFLRDADKGHT